jgi:hypothetical protein
LWKLGVAALGVVMGYMLLFGGGSTDAGHKDLKKHEGITESRIVLSAEDMDREKTQDMRLWLQEGKDPEKQPALASLTPGMTEAVRGGDADYYHVFLFDSCAEDGDVVNLLIDGAPYAQIPITHAGTTLTVPLRGSGPQSVGLEGVHDGGGGITVACRTSQGEFFMKVMGVGEVSPIQITGR